ADRVLVVGAACVDGSKNDLVFQDDVAHPTAEVGRDGASVSRYTAQDQDAVRRERVERAESYFGNTYCLEDDVDFSDALRQTIQRCATGRNIVRTEGPDQLGPIAILGLPRKDVGLDPLSLTDHGAEQPYGPRTEDQSTQPRDVETET